MSSTLQAYAWSAGFITFGVFTGLMTIVIFRTNNDPLIAASEARLPANQETGESKITVKNWLVWISLSAIGLLRVTLYLQPPHSRTDSLTTDVGPAVKPIPHYIHH